MLNLLKRSINGYAETECVFEGRYLSQVVVIWKKQDLHKRKQESFRESREVREEISKKYINALIHIFNGIDTSFI